MTPRHLDDLFSAAYESELSSDEEARFESHMHACTACAAAYAEFRAGVEALRELPRARMPHAVHLPSTPPVAERSSRPRAGLSWFNLGLLRRFPATAVAGGIAVVLVVAALAHGNGGSSTGTVVPATANGPNAHAAPSSVEAACAHPITAITGATPPATFIQEDLATDPALPAVHLVLATPSLVVTAGTTAVVYAQLTEPVSSIANPDSTGAAQPARAVLPCVSIGVGANGQQVTFSGSGAVGAAGSETSGDEFPGSSTGLTYGGLGSGPLLSFKVPAGLAPGTELQVTATIPAGYTGLGSPQLTAVLTLTTG
jgi:anti-sigma factor RsiW